MSLDTLLGPQVGPRWEGNQRAEYARELAEACQTRAQSLGFAALTRSKRPDSDSRFTAIFEQAIEAAVREIPAALERGMFFRDSWGRDQCERLARDCPTLRGGGGGFPVFSDEPTAGQHLAWRQFENRFITHYFPRVSAIRQRELQEIMPRLEAERQEKQRLKKEELRTSLARGVAAWSLADLKADCKLLDLKVRRWRRASRHRRETGVVRAQVSGNKGQLFDRLQGYVDGTVHPKKRRRF